MELTYVGHACLLAEAGPSRVLMDPWMAGPCQANGWWHLPPPALNPEQLPKVDFILISHIHDDHFHLPTLERLPKSATAVIPFSVDPWMGEELRQLGFTRVVELEHGRAWDAGAGLRVTNFQFGRLDSAYLLEHGGRTLFNLNDCPVPLSWLRRWRRRHPAPDAALSAYSYASPYPLCYEIPGWDPRAAARDSAQRVMGQFCRTMETLEPRYAVPFATQYALLLPGELWMNGLIPTPEEPLRELRRRSPRIRGVLLNPGDRLDLTEGPSLSGPGFDWKRKGDLVARIALEQSARVRETLAAESLPPADWAGKVEGYFQGLLRRNPGLTRRIGVPVALEAAPGGPRWVLDCSPEGGGEVRLTENRHGSPAPIEIRLPPAILWAAVDGQIHWETLYLSNRLRVKVPQDLMENEWSFWRILFNFRQGMLRDRLRFLTPRGLRVLFRRREEIAGLLLQRLRRSSQREPDRDV